MARRNLRTVRDGQADRIIHRWEVSKAMLEFVLQLVQPGRG
jgi:hypothetical protein